MPTEPIDCMVCGTEKSLTPARIAHIREKLKETRTFKDAEKAALETLRRLSAKIQALDSAALTACPRS